MKKFRFHHNIPSLSIAWNDYVGTDELRNKLKFVNMQAVSDLAVRQIHPVNVDVEKEEEMQNLVNFVFFFRYVVVGFILTKSFPSQKLKE